MAATNPPTHAFVRKAYGRVATQAGGCCGPQSSCFGGGRADPVALASLLPAFKGQP